ncbi:SseB family protein [Streptomyces monticola]|uniref:SseB family protein n=1 Tax=Streptomyces monticola TaxID=2666263 RepID=A0ABW2JW13_9ACTN
MDIPSANSTSPAQAALSALATQPQDQAALDTLAESSVLLPVPDEVSDAQDPNAAAMTLPVLEEPGGEQLVPVFTSELRMTELLPSISHCQRVPLGALAAQWPSDDLSLAIDAGSPDALTLTADGVRTLLARPRG